MINSFEDLKIWQKAKELCNDIHQLTQEDRFAKDYSLKNQINSSSGSIMDNVAEGFGRKGNAEFINFLTYANGSSLECKSQLYRALERNYITAEKQSELFELIDEITKMITSLIKYLSHSEIRGEKFKDRKN